MSPAAPGPDGQATARYRLGLQAMSPAGGDGVLRSRGLPGPRRRLREAAGVSADKAAYEIRSSRSKISRMENGRVGFKIRDIEDLLTLYGVTGGQQRSERVPRGGC